MALITRGNNMRLLRGGRVQALIMQGRPRGGSPVPSFNPSELFAANEQGAWYDPSDLTSMFQNAAGTTPAALEQPVGLLRDKSGRGNHASQTTLAARPVLSARYNLLTYTEQFNNAAWTLGRVYLGSTSVSSPIGTATATELRETTEAGSHYIVTTAASGYPVTEGVTYSATWHVKKGAGAAAPDIVQFVFASLTFGLNAYANFSFATNSFTFTGSAITNATLVALDNGWYRITLQAVCTATAALSSGCVVGFCNNNPSAARLPVYTGITTSTMYIWGADFRVANDGVGIPSYQRVAAATDYDTTGFPTYLRFDGVDDCLFTSAINFTATDKMTVFAGARKLSDAATGIICELSSDASSATGGAFALFSGSQNPNGGAATPFSNYVSFVHTTGVLPSDFGYWTTENSYAAPITNVLSSALNIALKNPGSVALRSNATAATRTAASSTYYNGTTLTGNFGTNPIFIGRRNNATLQWSGRLYSLIVRGAQSTDTQITQTETWVNSKTKAY